MRALITGSAGFIGSHTADLLLSKGYSLLEVMAAARRITGQEIPLKLCPKRDSDPAVLVASSNQAQTELGWRPQSTDFEDIRDNAQCWFKKHPGRYA